MSWFIYTGQGRAHDGIKRLPAPPNWRRFDGELALDPPAATVRGANRRLGDAGSRPRPDDDELNAVNAALYLRRPLLVTGKPGTGKSSLAYAVARELQLGPVLRWPITSRSTVRDGLYQYDAIGRLRDENIRHLRASAAGWDADGEADLARPEDIGRYLTLGPLGTALLPWRRPRVLLIDEIDKGDVDLTADLLNLFEDGEFEIPELSRLPDAYVTVRTADGDGTAMIRSGAVRCRAFPFVVLTSNEERDFLPAFLRRCVRLDLAPPDDEQLAAMVTAHLGPQRAADVRRHVDAFLQRRTHHDLAADQLLSLMYLLGFNPDGAEPGQPMAETVLRPLNEG